MSIQFAFKLTLAYISKFRRVVFVSLLFGVLIFTSINIFLPYFSSLRNFRIGVIGKYKTNDLPINIQGQITRGITKIGEDGTPLPDLAESWDVRDEAKTWVFNLASGIVWHDKTRLNSQNVLYEFEDVIIETPQENQIIFKLKESYSPFPSVLAKPVFRKGLIGTGDWQVDKISLVSDYVEKLTLVNKAKEKKTYKFYPSTENAKLAFKLGEVDEIHNLFDPAPFDKWTSVDLTSDVNKNQVVTLFFNTESASFTEKSFRQALAYAIDKDKFGDRAVGPISPLSWAYNPQVKPYTYDTERAGELLGTLPENSSGQVEINLVTPSTLLKVAEQIAKDWEAVGIKVHIQVSSIIPEDFQVYLTIYDIPSDPDQYPIWHSTQKGTNISRFASPRIDKILEDGRVETDIEERKKIYLDFQRFLLEDVPAIFLYHPTYYSVARR